MLTFDQPDQLDGLLLQEDLAEAGITTALMVDDNSNLILLDTDDEATARPIVEAHAAKVREAQAARETGATNRQTIEGRALAALQANRDFLALQAPTNAQVLAQVRAVTRQSSNLIRLVLERHDATD